MKRAFRFGDFLLEDEELPWNDRWEGWEIGRDETVRYLILPLIVNHRLIVLRHEADDGELEAFDYGWCYPPTGIVLDHYRNWDPPTEDEPLGWHKRVCAPRRAPRRDLKPAYNRPRCRHGSYTDAFCRVDPDFCGECPRSVH